MHTDSTIVAIATAPIASGVIIIRVSGPLAKDVITKIFFSKKSVLENPREMIYGQIIDYRTLEILDNSLVCFFKAPNSFTGEDLLELHIHGSPILAKKIIDLIASLGVSFAQAGEFSQRAFLNGKIDLIQAEAIGELISATSEKSLKVANDHLQGKLSSIVSKFGDPLKDFLAEIEANIDFPEEDISPETIEAIKRKMQTVLDELNLILSTFDYGKIIKEGFKVLICGKPNAGKSSLLNKLLGTNRAIVTNIKGTTRDLIEEAALIDGYKFIFCDSAGITETNDEVEKIGIELAIEKLAWADLVLLVIDASDTDNFEHLFQFLKKKNNNIWLIVNKIDLNKDAIGKIFCDQQTCSRNIYISASKDQGIDNLQNALVEEVLSLLHETNEASVIVTNERQKLCLSQASINLEETLRVMNEALPLEIISIELRNTLNSLEELIGKTYTEDILGRIFSKFCIGK